MKRTRYWFVAVLAHAMLAVCAFWVAQHIAKVRAHGWFASLGLTGASQVAVFVTFAGLALVYFMQIRLVLLVVSLWRDWLGRSRTRN
jgi:hypothetical protein